MPTSHKKTQARQRRAVRDASPHLIVDQLTLRVGVMQGAEFDFYYRYREMTRKIVFRRACAYHYNGHDVPNFMTAELFAESSAEAAQRILRSTPDIQLVRENTRAAYGMHVVNHPDAVKCVDCWKLNRPIQCPEGMVLDPHEIVVFDKPDGGVADRYTTLPYLQLDQEGADPKWSDPNNALMYLGHCETGKTFSQWGELAAPMGDYLGTRVPWHRLHPRTRMHIRMRVMEGG